MIRQVNFYTNFVDLGNKSLIRNLHIDIYFLDISFLLGHVYL